MAYGKSYILWHRKNTFYITKPYRIEATVAKSTGKLTKMHMNFQF
jgi:hypothetical protein